MRLAYRRSLEEAGALPPHPRDIFGKMKGAGHEHAA